jgi:hypothetical protein
MRRVAVGVCLASIAWLHDLPEVQDVPTGGQDWLVCFLGGVLSLVAEDPVRVVHTDAPVCFSL